MRIVEQKVILTFLFPVVISEVRALKFDTAESVISLLKIGDGFYVIAIFVVLKKF